MRRLLIAVILLTVLAGLGLSQVRQTSPAGACPEDGREASRLARAVDRLTDTMDEALAAGGRSGPCRHADPPRAEQPGAEQPHYSPAGA
ncbi:hypothetical protein [Actinomadura macrotermitis]|uniref:Uncharacterized protein n=1 Tax=Actinomadura macrotermitis TaxID=2585200 RepID=A0A7K0C0A7_9ACTN|nr:hypothetical protein [Actinomadura macrotermitis]MQY06877.1 hypothetical protein [Actinomadura macrotermitis]